MRGIPRTAKYYVIYWRKDVSACYRRHTHIHYASSLDDAEAYLAELRERERDGEIRPIGGDSFILGR